MRLDLFLNQSLLLRFDNDGLLDGDFSSGDGLEDGLLPVSDHVVLLDRFCFRLGSLLFFRLRTSRLSSRLS